MWEYIDFDAELYHHGVKGMKWGVRRSPEQLGHPAPRKRKGVFGRKAKKAVGSAGKSVGRGISKAGKAAGHGLKEGVKKARDAHTENVIRSGNADKIYKNRKHLTDQELKRAVNRVRDDQALKDMNQSKTSKFVRKGTESVGHTLEKSGLQVLGALAAGVMTYQVHKYITNTRGRDYADSVLARGKSIKYGKERISPNYTSRPLKKYGRTPVTKVLKAKNDYSNRASDVPLLTGPTLKGSHLQSNNIKRLAKRSTQGRYEASNVKRLSKARKSYSDRVKWKVK